MNKLKDWTSLLTTFKSAVAREKPTMAFPGQCNTHLRLFKWLSYLSDARQSTKIKINMVAAAIHLAFFRNHRFDPHEIPELTGDLSVLIAAQSLQVFVFIYKSA
jgi:hypothetical protein